MEKKNSELVGDTEIYLAYDIKAIEKFKCPLLFPFM